jgi:putative phage-type endonuclease
MIIVNCEQRSAEWHAARLGIPTASSFSKIVTSKGELSKQAAKYMLQLVREWFTGQAERGFVSYWMERGAYLEPEALAYYALKTGREAMRVGFVYKDERRLVGCSPDGLFLADESGGEIKCPSPKVHQRYIDRGEIPTAHIAQVQGQMWITGAKEWTWVSYHPEMPAVMLTVERDEVFIAQLEICVNAFVKEMLKQREKMLPPRPRATRAERLSSRQAAMRIRQLSPGRLRATMMAS